MSSKKDVGGLSFSELGVTVTAETKNKLITRLKNSTLFREFTLATLSTTVENHYIMRNSNPIQSPIHAFDAFPGTGLAAFQWRKHLRDNVQITVAEQEGTSLIKQNAKNNSLECNNQKLDPSKSGSRRKNCNYIPAYVADPKVVMMLESYDFIYMYPYKNIATYLEPAFHNINSIGGVICLAVPDLFVFVRVPELVRQCYDAQLIKTEYIKEMATRTIIAQAARSAAKYKKCFSVLYVVHKWDSVLICLRTSKGAKDVEGCLNSIAPLIHCRFCEEREFLPNQLAPLEQPYDYLKCSCKTSQIGKTAVILGPMWKGPIFDTAFLEQVTAKGKNFKLSAKFFEVAQLLLDESRCSSSPLQNNRLELTPSTQVNTLKTESQSEICDQIPRTVGLQDSKSTPKPSGEESTQAPSGSRSACKETDAEPCGKICERPPPENNADVESCDLVSALASKQQGSETLPQKRVLPNDEGDLGSDLPPTKKLKDGTTEIKTAHVPFYYSVKRSKKTDLPKLDKLVTTLQQQGHHASRTHFEYCSIRTSASVDEFMHILDSGEKGGIEKEGDM